MRLPLHHLIAIAMIATLFPQPTIATGDEPDLPKRVIDAMQKAGQYFHRQVAVNGGYVYECSLDLNHREGEGRAADTEIWVQPPGTPTVGMAFLTAFRATGNPQFLAAAHDAAKALMFGQLESGGWSSSIDFDPKGKHADRYRNGLGRAKGRNYSTLDDDKTQAAVCFLMQLDQTLEFRNAELHEATLFALNSILSSQFANGGFPQGWKSPVSDQPVKPANYPDHDWRTENRIKEYWDYYTLNDGLAGTVARTLHMAHEVYGDEKYHDALIRLGEFLLLAQMPEPQPAWAQQYNFDMQPMWARKFEPPAISGLESQDVMWTLLFLFELTGDDRYLPPVEAAIGWLNRSKLPDGRVARFYELQTNRPLYFVKDSYELTYDDSNMPTHYGFQMEPKTDQIQQRLNELRETGKATKSKSSLKTLTRDAQTILSQLDEEGRWLVDGDGKPASESSVRRGDARVSSRQFSKNMNRLSEFLQAATAPDRREKPLSCSRNTHGSKSRQHNKSVKSNIFGNQPHDRRSKSL